MVEPKNEASISSEVESTEITQEMIEAGCGELSGFNPDLDSGAELVAMIYRAMRFAADSQN